MMLATEQHVWNRGSDTDPSLFRNDANNVAAFQSARFQKKLMEEAARLQQEQLDEAAKTLRVQIEDKEKVQQERDELRTEKESLTQTVARKDGEIEGSKNEIGRLKAANQEAQNQMEILKSQLTIVSSRDGQRQTEVDSLKQTIGGLEKKVPGSRQDNSLPFHYHGSTVMIVNLRSQMALDVGKDNGTRAYVWEYIVDNTWQIFTLSKVSGDPSPDSYWTISRKEDGRKLYYPTGNTDVDVHVGSAPGKQDYWYIGRGSNTRVGSWVIKNAEWGTYIESSNGSKDNGTRVKSYPFSDNWDANWVIIPLSFSS